MDFGWLGPAAQPTVEAVIARHVAPEGLQEALRAAYWAAQRAGIPGVAARHRDAVARRVVRLARLEEAITAVLDLPEPVAADLAGHLHVARAHLRREVPATDRPAGPGRPRGWRAEAERELLGAGVPRRMARALLGFVAARVRERPLGPSEVPILRAALRAGASTRRALLIRFPIPPRFGRR